MLDSVIVTTPVSSPLHPQAALPLLKGYLKQRGYKTRVIDTNIGFFHWFLGNGGFSLTMDEVYQTPLKILETYNAIEEKLWQKSRAYDGLAVGMRYLGMKYDRTRFDSVIDALEDGSGNPFIQYYRDLIKQTVLHSGIRIFGISITFQDQIVSAFTLADVLRKTMPEVKIVMGGQMITRCYETMLQDTRLCSYFDYLVLWDGEEPLLDIHRKEIRGQNVEFVNVIDVHSSEPTIDRRAKAPGPAEIPAADYTDIDFSRYFLPDMLVPLQTTRGCYGKCEFCAIPFGSNSYRIRPAEQIIDEIMSIQKLTKQRYGRHARLFKFMEDTSSPARLFDISVEIEKKGLDVKWETFARLEKAFTDAGFMEQLYRGGCRKIHWGLESSDPDVLKNMNKKITTSYADDVLACADEAGIFNFCFILIGFPGETDAAREAMIQYIIDNRAIHTITPTTFDLTRGAPMERHFVVDNDYGMTMLPAEGFQVRLPYFIHGENWKARIVPLAHKLTLAVVKERPDIGIASLFPDQIRSLFCDKFTNKWPQTFVRKYGEETVKGMLLNTEKYISAYNSKEDIDPDALPEALRREHFRTKEDIRLFASAVATRRKYEERRFDQV